MHAQFESTNNYAAHTPIINEQAQLSLHSPFSQVPASDLQALRFVFDFLLAVRDCDTNIFTQSFIERITSSLPASIKQVITCLPAVRAYCHQYGGHPYFHSLLWQIERYELERAVIEQNPMTVLDKLDEFMMALKFDLKTCQSTPTHQERIYNSSQLSSMQKLIHDAFERCSKVLVLRVDLRYKDHVSVTYEQAKDDIGRFIDSKRFNTLFDDVIGFACKLERGANFHFHTLWLMNGHKHQKDAYLAQCIGERWSNMTQGRGIAYNCNYDKQNYQQCGIGMIHRTETEKKAYLLNAAQYLCKEDPLTKAYIPAGHRTFFRSVVK